jgi:hypothetical protein
VFALAVYTKINFEIYPSFTLEHFLQQLNVILSKACWKGCFLISHFHFHAQYLGKEGGNELLIQIQNIVL